MTSPCAKDATALRHSSGDRPHAGHMERLLGPSGRTPDIVLRDRQDDQDFPDTDARDRHRRERHHEPAARTTNGPIAMPVSVSKAKTSVVVERSIASGYAGVDDALFYEEQPHAFAV